MRYFKSLIRHFKQFAPERQIILIALFAGMIMIFAFGPQSHWDTPSYLRAWTVIKTGHLDVYRTPLYPAIIGFAHDILPNVYEYVVIILQHAVFIFSSLFFFKIAIRFCGYKNGYFLSIVYVVFPFFFIWGNKLYTESFAISLSVMIIYFMLDLFDCQFKDIWKMIKSALVLNTLLILMLMLRPSGIFFVGVILIAFLFSLLRRKFIVSLLFLSTILIGGLAQISYVKQINKDFGLHTPTFITTINRYIVGRYVGVIKSDGIADPSLKSDIEKFIAKNGESVDFMYTYRIANEMNALEAKYDMEELEHFVDGQYNARPVRNILAVLHHNTHYSMRFPIFESNYLFSYFPASFILMAVSYFTTLGFLYLLLIAVAMKLLWEFFVKKDKPYESIILLVAVFLNIVISLVGAQNEWSRLFLPVMPMAIILIVASCQDLIKEKSHGIKLNFNKQI